VKLVPGLGAETIVALSTTAPTGFATAKPPKNNANSAITATNGFRIITHPGTEAKGLAPNRAKP
jgi:hypothetical protein